jgi:hypothetical protein
MYTADQALATISAFPADNAAVTFIGAASTQYAQNLVYHKDAITFATADLLMPQVWTWLLAKFIRRVDAYCSSIRYQQRSYALPY